jgi:energy-converting hydrogenase Eha subunit A
MGKVLVPTLVALLFSVCAAAAIELQSSDNPADHPFGMTEFAALPATLLRVWQQAVVAVLIAISIIGEAALGRPNHRAPIDKHAED